MIFTLDPEMAAALAPPRVPNIRAVGLSSPPSGRAPYGRSAFTRQRVADFIDGCFWHGCPEHGTSPATNPSYWLPKRREQGSRRTAFQDAA
jgi:hypothetical protein